MRFAELTTRLGQDPILTRILVCTLHTSNAMRLEREKRSSLGGQPLQFAGQLFQPMHRSSDTFRPSTHDERVTPERTASPFLRRFKKGVRSGRLSAFQVKLNLTVKMLWRSCVAQFLDAKTFSPQGGRVRPCVNSRRAVRNGKFVPQ